LFCEKIVPESVSVISQAQFGEFIDVKVVDTNDYDLLVKQNLIHKKSLCAKHAEANSERNLYAPPLRFGIKLSLHVIRFISINPALSLVPHLKSTIKTLKSKSSWPHFLLYFNGPIKPKACERKG
jgi:hypothetical protein